MIRLIQISDTHLSADDAKSCAGWMATREYIERNRPDLVIHTGDIVRDDPAVATDREYASRELAALGIEVLSVPGNHDVGDGPPVATTQNPALLDQFGRAYGEAHWCRDIGSWRLIGINAMLFGFGCDEEARHRQWFSERLASCPGDRQVAVFMHKPPFIVAPEEPEDSSMAIPLAGKLEFWKILKRFGVRLVACGHRHEYRATALDGIQIVWAPTTSNLLCEQTPPLPKRAYPGFVEYVLAGPALIHRVVPIINGSIA